MHPVGLAVPQSSCTSLLTMQTGDQSQCIPSAETGVPVGASWPEPTSFLDTQGGLLLRPEVHVHTSGLWASNLHLQLACHLSGEVHSWLHGSMGVRRIYNVRRGLVSDGTFPAWWMLAGEMFLPGEHVEHWTQPLPASGEGWVEDRGPRMTTPAPAVNWS